MSFKFFTSSTTWIVPENIHFIDVECQGGGGNGGQSNESAGGGGGGSGYYKRNVCIPVKPHEELKIIVGGPGQLSRIVRPLHEILIEAQGGTHGSKAKNNNAGNGGTGFNGGGGGLAHHGINGQGGYGHNEYGVTGKGAPLKLTEYICGTICGPKGGLPTVYGGGGGAAQFSYGKPGSGGSDAIGYGHGGGGGFSNKPGGKGAPGYIKIFYY